MTQDHPFNEDSSLDVSIQEMNKGDLSQDQLRQFQTEPRPSELDVSNASQSSL